MPLQVAIDIGQIISEHNFSINEPDEELLINLEPYDPICFSANVCSGSVTIGANGSIQSHGNRGGDNTGTGDNSSMGGGSGGGHIMLATKGVVTASGSAVASAHYVGSAGSQVGGTGTWGEKTYNLSCWGGRGGKNPETSHVPVQDMYTGTSTTRQGGAGGKGIISVYAGVLV